MQHLIRAWLCSSALLATGFAPWTVAADVTVDNGWVRAMPPGQSVTALYFDVVNHTDGVCTLTAVATPAAERTELHRTEEEGGMARMRRQEFLEVAPHATLSLAPGGDHVMLYGIAERLEPDTIIDFEVDLGVCGRVAASATVRKATGTGGGHQGHHHHH